MTSPAVVPIRLSPADLLPRVLAGLNSPHSKRAYASAIRAWLAWGGTLDRAGILAYRESLLEARKRPVTVNAALAAIRKLAAEAVTAGWIGPREGEAISSIPGVKRLGSTAGNWLDREHLRLFLELPDTSTLAGKRDAALLHLLVAGAFRREEVASLTVEQFRRRPGLVDLAGKGGRLRTVPLRQDCLQAVETWLVAADIQEGLVMRSWGIHGEMRGGLTGNGVWRIVREYAGRLGVRGLGAHDLRRSRARALLDDGVPIEQISALLGHSAIATTQIYLGLKQADPAIAERGW